MLKVKVRIDKVDAPQALHIEGEAHAYPVVGVEWEVFVYSPAGPYFQVKLGTVLNIKVYGDMLLVRTDLTVAEVWVISGEVEHTIEKAVVNGPAAPRKPTLIRLVKEASYV
jgi:hypothetical protein